MVTLPEITLKREITAVQKSWSCDCNLDNTCMITVQRHVGVWTPTNRPKMTSPS